MLFFIGGIDEDDDEILIYIYNLLIFARNI